MANLVLGCLVYLNDNVFDRRIDMCRQSFESFKTFETQVPQTDIVFINNGNDPRVSQELSERVNVPYSLINLNKNFFDISVHMCTFWRAVETGAPYFAYTYDDFVFYDENWVEDALTFMDYNPIRSCLRLPEYRHNDPWFDTMFTSKQQNPDAVRHDVGAGPSELTHKKFGLVGTHEFYFSNWRPNSRPTLWRTADFGRMIAGLEAIPVMQSFEAYMYAYADKQAADWGGWKSGFIEGGVCRTFPAETSERTQVSNHYRDVMIDKSELLAAYEVAR